ncbi:MAG TPA: hypothetical protein VFH45_04200, partial [Acidimicrobiales bacterium]|nr:hypothetical protein [Acidimicrobiales bacterium]
STMRWSAVCAISLIRCDDRNTVRPSAARARVRVRSPQACRLAELLRGEGATVEAGAGDGVLTVAGADTAAVGDLAALHSVSIHELVAEQASLEDAFMELTRGSVEYLPHATPKERVA